MKRSCHKVKKLSPELSPNKQQVLTIWYIRAGALQSEDAILLPKTPCVSQASKNASGDAFYERKELARE